MVVMLKTVRGTSLAVHRLGLCLPVQGLGFGPGWEAGTPKPCSQNKTKQNKPHKKEVVL